jgi:hypothetical protein
MRRLIAIALSVVGLLGTASIASADPPSWANNHANNHAQSESDNQGPCDALRENGARDDAEAWDVHNCGDNNHDRRNDNDDNDNEND